MTPATPPAPNLAEHAYAEVKRLIFDFVLMPGDHFSESELARRVEVSRSPLRQALQRLCEVAERPGLQALADLWLVDMADRIADGVAVGALDEAFHRALVASSGNREMARVHADITERIRIIRRLDFTKRDRVAATYDEHARILGAITRRRSDEAQRLLRAHIGQSKLEVRHITLDMLYRAREPARSGPA